MRHIVIQQLETKQAWSGDVHLVTPIHTLKARALATLVLDRKSLPNDWALCLDKHVLRDGMRIGDLSKVDTTPLLLDLVPIQTKTSLKEVANQTEEQQRNWPSWAIALVSLVVFAVVVGLIWWVA